MRRRLPHALDNIAPRSQNARAVQFRNDRGATAAGSVISPGNQRLMNKKLRWRVAIASLVILAALGTFLWFARQKPQSAPQGRFGLGAPMAVATATAAPADIPVKLAALGTITPLATVTIRTQISGQLQQIGFREGQMLHKGDFLAQIDPRPYQNTLAQAEGVLARDQAMLNNARLDVKRYIDLVAQGSIPAQTLDTQKSQVEQLVGTVATDTAQVATAKLNLQYTHIVSPIDGRAGLRQVDLGNYVTPGDASGIVVITQLQPVSAIFPIPEDNLPVLMRQLHQGALQVQAYDRSDKTLLATGTMSTVDNEVDTATGTVKLRALFDNKDELLFPNQFVNIQLLVTTLHDQIVVPAAAIQRGSINGVAGSFVYLVNSADSTVSVRGVTLGATDGERVAVASGLAAGDVVVTEGGDRLRDGAKVQLRAGSAPAGAPGAGTAGKPGGNRSGKGGGKRRGTGAAAAGGNGAGAQGQ